MASSVTLTIDGKEISVPEGTTVLHAAKAAGIVIPHLCYCSGLKATGACRLCVVEIEKVRGLVVSCVRKVAPGMVVRTSTEQILEARRFIIELLLSRHPGLCLSCDKSGVCKLQRYAYELGIERPSYPVRDPGYPVDDANPFIVRNYNLCIVCGRCIRVCRGQGSDILDFVKRGIETKVATALDKPLQEAGCDFCGSCVGVCPTGALLEKKGRGKGREWELRAVESHCGYCGSACKLLYNLKGDDVVKVATERPADYLCARGRFGYSHIDGAARLETPLVRKNGELAPASWDEALEFVAGRLKGIKENYGPQAVGGIAGALATNETAYVFQKFIRAGLQSNNVDSGVRFSGLELLQKLEAVVGGTKGYAALNDVGAAGVILVVGDVWRRVPAVWGRIKQAADRGAKVVYIGFYAGRPVKIAKVWLRALPGSEHVVLQQMAQVVVRKEGNVKAEKEQITGFNRFAKSLKEAAGAPAGVSADDIAAAAELWMDAKAKGVVVLAVDGVTQQTGSAALNLCLLTGRVKKAFFPGHSLSNAQGVWRMGAVADCYPGLQPVSKAAARFSKLWGMAAPDTPGLAADEMLAQDSPLKALYVLQEDPVVSFPGGARVAARLNDLQLLVVQDLFLTETAKMADVVLPLASSLETGGTCVNAEGRVRQYGKVLPEKTLAVWQVIEQLASKMNFSLSYVSCRQVGEEARAVAPNFGITPGTSPRPAFQPVNGSGAKAEDAGSLRLVPFASRFGFYNDHWIKNSGLDDLLPYQGDFVAIAPEDADRLGLAEGAPVSVSTAYGQTGTVVQVDPGLPAGVVIMPAFAAKTNMLLGPDGPNGPVAAALTKL
ncbi:MAG: molybdopterin-dependent oxidoreductase [Bacillota bacterium]